MTPITASPPSTVQHAATPVGSKKDTSRTDLKSEIATGSVDKNMTAADLQGRSKDPETRFRTKADGSEHLVTLQEGVRTESPVPVAHSDRLHKSTVEAVIAYDRSA